MTGATFESFQRELRRLVIRKSERVNPETLPMNLVAADVSPLHLDRQGSLSRLTSAAKVLGFKGRTWLGRFLSPGERIPKRIMPPSMASNILCNAMNASSNHSTYGATRAFAWKSTTRAGIGPTVPAKRWRRGLATRSWSGRLFVRDAQAMVQTSDWMRAVHRNLVSEKNSSRRPLASRHTMRAGRTVRELEFK